MSNAYRELTLPAQVDRLPEVLSLIEEQLELAGCPMKTQIQLSVAAEEVFVNIASYAYAPASGMATIRMEYVEETSTVSMFSPGFTRSVMSTSGLSKSTPLAFSPLTYTAAVQPQVPPSRSTAPVSAPKPSGSVKLAV